MKDKQIRKEYAFLKKNKEIYFDNNASSLKPNCVVKAVNFYNAYVSTNTGRSVYKLEYYATKKVEETRQKVAQLINANAEEIVFTKNTTESLNLAVLSYAYKHIKKDDEILLSVLEHHSLYLPLLELSKKVCAKLVFVDLDENHKLTLENFKNKLTSKTKLVALTHISNVTGNMIDAKELISEAHKMGATVILDSAQAVPHKKVDVLDLDCDFLSFSGYKMGAPTGVGVLYAKQELLKKMEPIYFGGGMVLDALSEEVEYKYVPYKFEAGTLDVAAIIGLGVAIDYLQKTGYDYIEKKDNEFKNYMIDELSKIEEVEIYNKNTDIATVIFNIKGFHAHDIATAYDMYNICVRAGHNCVQPFVNYLGQVSILRASLYFYNTKAEIDTFIKATKKIVDYFKQF